MQHREHFLSQEIEEASYTDDDLCEARRAVEIGRFESCKQYMPIASELCVIGMLLLIDTRIVSLKKLRPRALALAHEGQLSIVGKTAPIPSDPVWRKQRRSTAKHVTAVKSW